MAKKIFSALLAIYIGIAGLATPYYNWQYAKKHGFWNWLLFGEVVATIQALGWPVDLLLRPQESSLKHLVNSLKYTNQATRILNKGEAPAIADPDERGEAFQYLEKALQEARLVEMQDLDFHFGGFGDHYENEFIAGHRLMIEGYRNLDNARLIRGQLLLDKWESWFFANRKDIKDALKREIELQRSILQGQ